MYFTYDKTVVVPNSEVIRRLGTAKFPRTFSSLEFGGNFQSVIRIFNIVKKVRIFLFIIKWIKMLAYALA